MKQYNLQKDLQSVKKEKKCVCLGLGLATEQKAGKQRTESLAESWPVEIRVLGGGSKCNLH